MNKIIDKKYGDATTVPVKHKQKNSDIIVTTNLPNIGDVNSVTQHSVEHMLPLLFYWKFDENYNCTLNSKIPVNNFTTTISSYANKSLRPKLNGNHLELSVDSIPMGLDLNMNEHLVFLLVAHCQWTFVHVQPNIQSLTVSYKLLSADHSEIKKGRVIIPDLNKKIAIKILQSPRKKILEYLDNYDSNIAIMSKQVIDKIALEL